MTKKSIIYLLILLFSSTLIFSSCYSYKNVVGVGAYGNDKVTGWNHYLVYGLIRVSVSDSKDMADGAKDYSIHTRQTFLNYVLSFITLGIYTPTTTTVTVNKKEFKER